MTKQTKLAHTSTPKQYIRCFVCNARLLEANSFMATTEDGQKVRVGEECYWKLATYPYGTDNPWQPPKGGPRLVPGWREDLTKAEGKE